MWPQDWKRSVFIPIPKKGKSKACSNYGKVPFIPHTSKAMLKIFQARLQQYVNHELLCIHAGFRKGRGSRNQLPTSFGSQKNKRITEKKSLNDSYNHDGVITYLEKEVLECEVKWALGNITANLVEVVVH